jgi:long-chain fatty acid transport protein
MISKNFRLAGAAAIALSTTTGAAQAGGFALREQSTVGLGNAFAGAAAGGSGLASMFWNPATMTDYAGLQSSLSLFAIMPSSEITPSAGTNATVSFLGGTPGPTGDMAQDAVLPASYTSWQVGERVWLGLALNTPYGSVTQNPYNWAGQVYGRTSKVTSINATPTVAYQVNDWLALGAGVQIMSFKVRLNNAIGVANNAPSVELKGDDTAVGFTAGATLKPMAGTEIGIGYRSRVLPKLDGTIATPLSVTGITSDVKLPDQVTIGIRQRVSDDFTLLAGWEWTHWGLFSRFPVIAKNSGATPLTLAFDYRDSWFASLGAEYAWSRDLTVRAGLGFEKSPIRNDTRTVRLPDSDRTWATLGMSYKWNDNLSVDASYAHLFAKSGTITVASPLPFAATTKSHVDLISLGLTYRWDNPKKAIPVVLPALVTKG